MRSEEWWAARHARLVKNEESFRQYNNRRLEREPVDAEDDEELIPFVCECGNFECVQALLVTANAFTEAHSAPDRFMVIPGHVFEDVERVIATRDGYQVVEKFDMDIDDEWARQATG
jgi:hypothetical protein